MSATFSAPLDAAEIARLEAALRAAGFAMRDVPHARFSGKGEGVTVTLYRSGKCVVQGKGLEQFLEHHLPGHRLPPGPGDAWLAVSAPAVGSDESGKGDYFGPLVTVAVRLAAEDVVHFEGVPLGDSKKMSMAAIRRAAEVVRASVTFSEVVLMPPKYNELYDRFGRNLNRLLAWCHAAAIEDVLERAPAEVVVIDRFADEAFIRRTLKPLASACQCDIRPRAESHPAVGAASILASETFDRRLAQLGRQFDITLPKGAGANVDATARRLVAVRGPDVLGQVAKLHFANTRKL